MASSIVAPAIDSADEMELVQRIVRHDCGAFEIVMRRYNAKLFRVARAILKNDADAEDTLQEAYLAAFKAMDRFEGTARLSTWLTRIVINQALGRLRARKRDEVVVEFAARDRLPSEMPDKFEDPAAPESPERATLQAQWRELLEQKIDALPLIFRTVFILREIDDMTVEETAGCLSIPAATVRSRLHRARAQLRESLAVDMDTVAGGIFPFAGARCDRIVAGVLKRLPPVSGASEDLSPHP